MRNRVQESCSHGCVGERGGNEPLYPEPANTGFKAIKGVFNLQMG